MRTTEAYPWLLFGSFEAVLVFFLAYMDDLLVAGASDEAVDMCKHVLKGAFNVRIMGVPTYLLGMKIGHRKKGCSPLGSGSKSRPSWSALAWGTETRCACRWTLGLLCSGRGPRWSL